MRPKHAVGVSAIRDAARKRAAETSGRATAVEIGMSETAFRHFLQGGKPHPGTRQKLVSWFVRLTGGPAEQIKTEDIDVALDLLVRYLADSPGPDVRRKRRAYIDQRLADSEE